MKIRRIDAAVALALAAFTLAACDRDETRTAKAKVDTAVTNTVNKTEAALDKAGQKAGELAAATAKSAEEARITALIKAGLVKDPELSALKIDVDTHGSVVTLNGSAPTPAAADRAAKIAIAVNGVSEVRNNLVASKG